MLRIVQAAVAGRSPRLRITLKGKSTRFEFLPAPGWTRELVEAEFLSARPSTDPALHALKQALWQVGLHHGRTFRLLLPGERQALVWDGKQLHRQLLKTKPQSVHLTVADTEPAELQTELLEFAHASPIPIEVDGWRLDRLQNSPANGDTQSSFPLSALLFSADVPVQPLPAGTRSAGRRCPTQAARLTSGLPVWGEPEGATLFALASLRVKPSGEAGLFWNLEVDARSTNLCWILHGVIVQVERLPLPRRAVGLTLYASAEGLATDASGLSLRTLQAEHDRRRCAIARAVQLGLASTSLDLSAAFGNYRRRIQRRSAGAGGSLVGAVGCLTWALLPADPTGLLGASLASWAFLTAAVAGSGWLARSSAHSDGRRCARFDKDLQWALEAFKSDWRRVRPNTWKLNEEPDSPPV